MTPMQRDVLASYRGPAKVMASSTIWAVGLVFGSFIWSATTYPTWAWALYSLNLTKGE